MIEARIVLCQPSQAGNVGAAARAMKVMGLHDLVLVDPQCDPAGSEAIARASGADDVLLQARRCTSVDEALEGVELALGASARTRRIALPQLDPREAAGQVLQARRDGLSVALLFGRERSGLTNEEINRCRYLVHIPSAPDYGSLNLAAAVQVLCYELRMAWAAGDQAGESGSEVEHRPASVDRFEGFMAHLEETLGDIGATTPGQSTTLLTRLRRLFQRAQPDDTEINILRGILSDAQSTARAPRG